LLFTIEDICDIVLGGLIKPFNNMDNQTIINAIVAINGSISVLSNTGDSKSIDAVTAKLLELVKKLGAD